MNYTTSSLLSLISRIHTLSAEFLNKKLSSDKFVSSHGFILFQLSENEKLTMSELSEKINRDKSTSTVLIRKLEKEGLVKTETCKNDNRVKYISLTEEGKKFNTFTKEISKTIQEVCYKDFSEEEKETLLHLLVKMCRNIENKKE